MDFLLIQSYLDKLPSKEDIKEVPEVAALIKIYSENIIDEELDKILDERHFEITTAKQESEIKNLDYSLDFYIEKLKEQLQDKTEEETEEEKIVINCLGTVYSKYIGNTIYSRKIMRDIADTLSNYNTLEYDIKLEEQSSLDEELNKLLEKLKFPSNFLIVNNIEGAIYALTNTFLKNKEIIMNFKDAIKLEKIGPKDILEKNGINIEFVGYLNNVTSKDYLDKLYDDRYILNIDMSYIPVENNISYKEFKNMNNKVINITDKVHIKTNRKEIKELSYELNEYLENEFLIDIVDFSKFAGLPKCAFIFIKDDEIYNEIKNDIIFEVLTINKETKIFLFHLLKAYYEENKDSIFIEKILLSEEEIKKKNQRILTKLEKEIGDKVEISLIEGEYLTLDDRNKNGKFERELIILTPKNLDAKEIEKKLKTGENPIFCWLHENSLIFNLQLLFKKDETKFLEKIKSVFSNTI
ncbi:MAG: L-seryl-tRNA(Ser) seleniumtransferase [Fusobacteriaceae bacterium]|jgi:seryl-tRNA(Sec) selenium transferase|nr:selA [Fusobacteriales bacterium]MDN5303901.1 L-seryl-tRNA(Ser) seleniumtransferase [Fusobacteriaceae bacterium]